MELEKKSKIKTQVIGSHINVVLVIIIYFFENFFF